MTFSMTAKIKTIILGNIHPCLAYLFSIVPITPMDRAIIDKKKIKIFFLKMKNTNAKKSSKILFALVMKEKVFVEAWENFLFVAIFWIFLEMIVCNRFMNVPFIEIGFAFDQLHSVRHVCKDEFDGLSLKQLRH